MGTLPYHCAFGVPPSSAWLGGVALARASRANLLSSADSSYENLVECFPSFSYFPCTHRSGHTCFCLFQDYCSLQYNKMCVINLLSLVTTYQTVNFAIVLRDVTQPYNIEFYLYNIAYKRG